MEKKILLCVPSYLEAFLAAEEGALKKRKKTFTQIGLDS